MKTVTLALGTKLNLAVHHNLMECKLALTPLHPPIQSQSVSLSAMVAKAGTWWHLQDRPQQITECLIETMDFDWPISHRLLATVWGEDQDLHTTQPLRIQQSSTVWVFLNIVM